MCAILSVNTGLGMQKAKGSAPTAELPQVTGMTWENREEKRGRDNTG